MEGTKLGSGSFLSELQLKVNCIMIGPILLLQFSFGIIKYNNSLEHDQAPKYSACIYDYEKWIG